MAKADPKGALSPEKKVIGQAADPAEGIHTLGDLKLGRAPKIPGRKALPFGNFLKTAPQHPITVDDLGSVDYALDENDRFGVCVPTSFDNFRRMVTTLLTGSTITTDQETVFAWYRSQNPNFNPDAYSEEDDQGMVIQYFLEWLVTQGLILGFASVDVNDLNMLQAASYLFLGLIVGVDLKTPQQGQTRLGYWDHVPGDTDEWGGHAVMVGAYSGDNLENITWDMRVRMTRAFIENQLDEAYVVILPDHISHPAFRAGFDLEKFAKAYEEITGRPFPVSIPPAPPVPGPEPVDPNAPLTFAVNDPEIQAHIEKSAKKSFQGDTAAWLDHHFRSYFDL